MDRSLKSPRIESVPILRGATRCELQRAVELGADGVSDAVTAILRIASQPGVSDLHLTPSDHALQLSLRVDGVLQEVIRLPAALSPNFVGRLKVLAQLLTYETACPQEGRIALPGEDVEFRIATFPTIFGEKVAIRTLRTRGPETISLAQLGFAGGIVDQLIPSLQERNGLILIVGAGRCR